MPGMFCHMAVKGLPSSKWPMIRYPSSPETQTRTLHHPGDNI